jgi:hypothetical protein
MKFKIKEVRPRIFLFEFKDRYEMCMTFLRYQECYESPNPKFRGKIFSILDFMEWYSKKDGGTAFTYPQDWSGFNMPAQIIPWIYNSKELQDPNKYDFAMYQAYLKCKEKYNDDNFCIIGAEKGQLDTLKHEIAHGFFYLIPEYRKEMTALVKALPKSYFKKACQALSELGYTKQVFIDECQAYLSTGDAERYFGPKSHKYNSKFISVYYKYYDR